MVGERERQQRQIKEKKLQLSCGCGRRIYKSLLYNSACVLRIQRDTESRRQTIEPEKNNNVQRKLTQLIHTMRIHRH